MITEYNIKDGDCVVAMVQKKRAAPVKKKEEKKEEEPAGQTAVQQPATNPVAPVQNSQPAQQQPSQPQPQPQP